MKQRIVTAALAAALTFAAALAAKWEGTRYVAYKPTPSDPWTICEGHTRGVREGDVATPEQCAAYKAADLLEAAQAVERCITHPLLPNQLGAFIDAAYNLGPAVVCGSTLQRKANAGDVEGACRELTDARNADGGRRGWSFAGGKFYPGLRARRIDDRALCWPSFANVRAGVVT
jgi:lysozyme